MYRNQITVSKANYKLIHKIKQHHKLRYCNDVIDLLLRTIESCGYDFFSPLVETVSKPDNDTSKSEGSVKQ